MGRQGRRPPKVEQIAAMLTYAAEHGDKAACERFGVSRTTLFRYRRRRAADPALAQLATAAEQKVAAAWLAEAKSARSTLLHRVVKLAEASEEVRDVVGALKIVSDAILAEQVVMPDGRPEQRAGVEGEGTAPAQAPGGSGVTDDPPVH